MMMVIITNISLTPSQYIESIGVEIIQLFKSLITNHFFHKTIQAIHEHRFNICEC